MTNQSKESNSFFNKFLNFTEKAGNALPHPATLFALMALTVIIFSGIADLLSWQATHPGTGETIVPVSLINEEGLHRILLEMVTMNWKSILTL